MSLHTFKACSGEMLGSDNSSFSTQRLSWESSSNTPSIFSTSQANQTYKHTNDKSVSTENYTTMIKSMCIYSQRFGDPYLRTQGLALDKWGCGIAGDPTNQRGEQTPISVITQGILHEAWKL